MLVDWLDCGFVCCVWELVCAALDGAELVAEVMDDVEERETTSVEIVGSLLELDALACDEPCEILVEVGVLEEEDIVTGGAIEDCCEASDTETLK